MPIWQWSRFSDLKIQFINLLESNIQKNDAIKSTPSTKHVLWKNTENVLSNSRYKTLKSNGTANQYLTPGQYV